MMTGSEKDDYSVRYLKKKQRKFRTKISNSQKLLITKWCVEIFDLQIKYANEAWNKGWDQMAATFLIQAENSLKDGIQDHQLIIDRKEILRQIKNEHEILKNLSEIKL